ncbi:MAG: hypothetical protein AB7D36_07200 [Oscillospiraceae bacterium]
MKSIIEVSAGEADDLKAVRRRDLKKVALGSGITLCLLLLAGVIKAFWIGWPVYSIAYSVSPTGDEIVICGGITDPTKTLRKVSLSKDGNNAYVTIYGCLPSFLTERTTGFYYQMSDKDIDAIYLGKSNNPKETMWIKGTSSFVGQTSLIGDHIGIDVLLSSEESITISENHPPEVSYSMAWAPAEQAVDLYLLNADNGTETYVTSARGGSSAGTLNLEEIADGTYYFALRNGGDRLETPDDRSVEEVIAQFRYVNYVDIPNGN